MRAMFGDDYEEKVKIGVYSCVYVCMYVTVLFCVNLW